MEHLGDITTNGQVVGKNFVEDPGLNRTLLGDGLATTVAALIGGLPIRLMVKIQGTCYN